MPGFRRFRRPDKWLAIAASVVLSFIVAWVVVSRLTASFGDRSLFPKAPDNTGTPSDFSITLQRVGCMGTCPDYTVTILANGSAQYDGRFYVAVEGVHQRTIPVSDVQKLVKKLGDEDFFHWAGKNQLCVDAPEIHITATLAGQRKEVVEGCSEPGKIMELADGIDIISGANRWVSRPPMSFVSH